MAITNATFDEFEGALSAVLINRITAAFASQMPAWEALALRGNSDGLFRAISTLQMPSLTSGQRKLLELKARAIARTGAESVSDAYGLVWRKPSDDRTVILSSAIDQLIVMERMYVLPTIAAAAAKIIADAYAAPLQKAGEDLRPIDFGYTPKLEKPSWDASVVAMRDSTRPATTFVANLTTSRLINYGALDAMTEEGVLEYRLKAKLDERTSKQCRALNGKKFRVEDGFQLLQRALMTLDDAAMKTLHPWVPGDSGTIDSIINANSEELHAKGWFVPPFHPRCRTVVVRARSTPMENTTLEPLPAANDDLPDHLNPLVPQIVPAVAAQALPGTPLPPRLIDFNPSLVQFLGLVALRQLLIEIKQHVSAHPDLKKLQDDVEKEISARGG